VMKTAEETELLALITNELDSISRDMHEQARRRNILREAATRLRTGVSAVEVEAALTRQGVPL
jgi:hypothetical protein